MSYLSEKAAYLKGLADGLKLEEKSDEGKLIVKIIELLEEHSATLEDIDEAFAECEERIDELEEFADEISEELSGCDCGCDCDDDCDCDCDDCDCDCDELEDLDFYEVTCPHCNEKVYFDEDMFDDGELICPNCDTEIEIEVEA